MTSRAPASPESAEGWKLHVLWYGGENIEFPFDEATTGLELRRGITDKWKVPEDEVALFKLDDWINCLHVEEGTPCGLSDDSLAQQGIRNESAVVAWKIDNVKESIALREPETEPAVIRIASSEPELDVISNSPSSPEPPAAKPVWRSTGLGRDPVPAPHTRRRWSDEETWALLTGVERHGVGRWADIRGDYELNPLLRHRSHVQLKDRWVNLVKTASDPYRIARSSQQFLEKVTKIHGIFWGPPPSGACKSDDEI